MLPKIIVAGIYDRSVLLSELSLFGASTMEYEGKEAKVDDLRKFINFGLNVATSQSGISLLIWDADRLSHECQAVLLKPLESTAENISLYLVASNENGLLPTVLSRCLVVNNTIKQVSSGKIWRGVLLCFEKGPAKCLALADELEREEMEAMLEEVITRLKNGLATEVNKNRLKILKLAIDCLSLVRFTNVNAKLAFGNFLISSWRLIKA